jgi:DNA (cytosine-5)-methyltransferase 1
MTKKLWPRTLVDLFAGSGGLALGFEESGFQTVYVNEIDHDAMATYLVNRRDNKFLDDRGSRSHDIYEITKDADTLRDMAGALKAKHGDIDVVAGGPPCQGYSMIGHRRSADISKIEIPSNHLYIEMAKVIDAVRPKAFLFENVRGLLWSKWTRDGAKGEIWRDVLATFEGLDDYEVRHDVVHAKSFGVPQNRPRVLIVGIRRDLGWKPSAGPGDGLIPAPDEPAPDPIDFLGDLVDPTYPQNLATLAYPSPATTGPQQWYRFDPSSHRVLPEDHPLSEHDYSKHSAHVTRKFQHMIEHGGEVPEDARTRKFSQRVLPRRWGDDGPTITATSLPDDYVHFSQPRILTVREWARLQTFPDWYRFEGRRTTGGRRRAGDPDAGNWDRELPKYTQIGNAVPVWMARHLAGHLSGLLDDLEEATVRGGTPLRRPVGQSANPAGSDVLQLEIGTLETAGGAGTTPGVPR